MRIPKLDQNGLLPVGTHDCSFEELRERFAGLQSTRRRRDLAEALRRYLEEVRATGLAVAVIVDGSFVTDKEDPGDVDLILVVRRGRDISAILRPFEYNVVSKGRVRKRYEFDLLVAGEDEDELLAYAEFFQKVRDHPELRKGLLRVIP